MQKSGRIPWRLPAASYAAVVCGMALGQRWLIYPGQLKAPGGIPMVGEHFFVPFEAGTAGSGTVPVWTVPTTGSAGGGSRPALLVWFHGNAEQLADTIWPEQSFVNRGLSFAAVEYAGFGEATGAGPTEATVLAGARAGLDQLRASSGPQTPIVCVGASLGTGVAAAMAAEGRCDRLELVSAYTSLPGAAQSEYPWLPAKWLVIDQFDTGSRAATIRVPTLLVHGTEDRTCPIWMGRQLARDIAGATLLERPRGHGDILDEEVYDRLAEFARATVSGTSP